MAAKIEDVARRAGVSTATVSRSLSLPDLVRPETRDRVLAAVRELGYLPNAAARNLRSGTTQMALVVLPRLAHVFFGDVVRGIEDELAAAGYGLIVGDLDNLVDREHHVFRMASATHVDGIILLTGRMLYLADRSLASVGLPIVAAVARIDHKGVPNVLVDERAGTITQIRHLHDLGHRRFAYLGAWPDNPNDIPRWAGFREGAAQLGVGEDQYIRLEGDYTFEGGARAAEAYLAIPPAIRPTGIVVSGDEMAIGFMKAVRRAGRSVPGDLSVIGFDGITFGEYCEPALTTIRQPQRPLGQAAARRLLGAMNGRPGTLDDFVLGTELVVRDSTGPAPRRA